MYLLDTNVISELAPTKTQASFRIAEWIAAHDRDLFISVVTISEIESGVARARRIGATRKATLLAIWLEAVIVLYGARILPVDVSAALFAGRLADQARSKGESPGYADLAIAGTAQVHDYIILTRNLRHFRNLGVAAMDPFDPSFQG